MHAQRKRGTRGWILGSPNPANVTAGLIPCEAGEVWLQGIKDASVSEAPISQVKTRRCAGRAGSSLSPRPVPGPGVSPLPHPPPSVDSRSFPSPPLLWARLPATALVAGQQVHLGLPQLLGVCLSKCSHAATVQPT